MSLVAPRPHFSPLPQRRSPIEIDLALGGCLAVFWLLVAYPLAAVTVATGLLLVLPASTPRHVRLMLGAFTALGIAMMAGARPLDPSAPNDIDTYYDTYEALASGDMAQLLSFGGGFEVSFPLLALLWSWILPPLTPNGLMFCLAFSAAALMTIWVESAFYAKRLDAPPPALMGLVLLMLNAYFATQLSRQFLALILLLFAISADGRVKQGLYVALAASFHITAIPFFGIYLLARRGPWGWAAIAAIAIAVRMNFGALVSAFDIVPPAIAEKLAYYVDNTQEFTEADVTSLRMIVLLSMISLGVVVASRFKPDRQTRVWIAVPWMALVVHLILLPIPLASLRTTLMIHSVAPGLVAYKLASRSARSMLPLLLGVLFVYKILGLATAADSGNLLSTFAMLGGFFK
jgi:hypothetical protein